jgi:hypothetical protein
MEKYLYFRSNATIGEDDDETNGSTIYPVSSFRGAVSGTSSALGVVSDDADALSLYFTPKGHIASGSAGDPDDAAGDNVDVVVVAITTDNNQKAVLKSIIQAMNGGPHSDGFIEIFDGVSGNKVDGDIEGVTIVHTVAAD